ncbi:MAG: hypothetical protein RDU14_16180 [Melioribacteraceae bacterium]|nr:hypothetical protein [Melioribacteraceae bacterium]
MSSILDIVGSFIIAGMIILLIITLNLNMNSISIQTIENNAVQINTATNSLIFDYDLYKIGYRVPSNRITKADSNWIIYRSDYDNNSTIDTLEYKTGATSELLMTTNPNDRLLYKKINSGNYVTMGVVSKCKIFYYDSLGGQISYASLSNQSSRDLIRTLKIEATFESPDSNYAAYHSTNWTRIFRPKNLK